MDANSFRHRFFQRLDCPWHLSQLFDYLPETYFYAKDVQGHFVDVNQAMAQLQGAGTPENMIGKTDFDFSPRDLAEQYLAEDNRVMKGRQPIVNQAWLVNDHRGVLRWYLSSKIPLWGDRGQVIGIAGAMRDVQKAGEMLAPYREMQSVLTHVFTRFQERIDFHQLARMVHLSLSQFDRKFKRLFHLTPQQFLLRVRVNSACQMLTCSDAGIAKIALESGFYDQSYFTKYFRRAVGITPTTYRRRYHRSCPSQWTMPSPAPPLPVAE